MTNVWMAAALAAALPSIARAQTAPSPAIVELPQIEVVGTTPIQGSEIDRDKVLVNTQALRRGDLQRTGPASALRALNENVGGIALNQAQGNEFQPNLTYRGFEASPLVGNAQGLAVYVNGARFNQPFGDTTNWDLIPDVAIEQIDLAGPNPAFGLNALGGAISVKLKDGFTYHGAQLELSGGSFGRIEGSAQYGIQSGNVSAYLAARGLNEDGWRDHSPSQLRQFYGDIGWRGDKSELHLNLLAATNNLTGNGTVPVDLLAASRTAVFTYPDETRNKYLRLSLSGSHEVNDHLNIQANAYYSNLAQRTRNSDAADVTACSDEAGLLCFNDGSPLTTRGGTRIPNFLDTGFPSPRLAYTVLNQTATDSNGYGASLQATHRSELLGRTNQLVLGASYDGGSTLFSARSSLGTLAPDRAYLGPGIVIAQQDGSITPVRLASTNDYYGLYAADTLDLTEALTITASARLNIAEIDLKDQTGTALTGNHAYSRLNPAAGLTYKILPGLSFYGGYSESNRVPSPAELSCASAASPCSLTNFFVNDPSLKQVVGHTVEIGLRGQLKTGETGRLSWNAGLFRTDSDDDILFTTSQIQGRGFFQNIGSTRRQGVEAGLNYRQGPLLAYASYAYTDATFRSPFTAGSQNNPAADADGLIQIRPGNRLPGIPAHLLKFGAHYEITPKWTIGLNGIASSGRYLQGDAANLTPRTDPFVVLNLDTSYRITEKIELFGLVQNLTDEKYATFGGFSPVSLVPILQAPGTTNTRSLTPAAPIAGFGGVRVTF